MVEVKKEFITYNSYETLLKELIDKIEKTKNKYGSIFGIPRGGLPIAVHLSHQLNIPIIHNILTLKRRDFPILLVDDISDTGDTLIEYYVLLERLYPERKFGVATLFYKPHSKYKPDFYVRETTSWIVFPWEKPDEKPNREMYEHL